MPSRKTVEAWWRRSLRDGGAWWLGPLAGLYAAGYWARRFFLALFGARPGSVAGALAVSVGNLAVGGTGKSPASMAIAAYFIGRRRRAFILSRGYGRNNGPEPLVVSSGEPGALVQDAGTGGDEPVMMARRLPRAGVIVDRDRCRAGRLAVEHWGAQVLVLDDGFQQRLRIARDLDLLLADAGCADGMGRLLPAGLLREPLAEGRSCDAVILTHARDNREFSRAKAGLEGLWGPKTFFRGTLKPEYLRTWPAGKTLPLGMLRRRRVVSLCALAQPGHFEDSLESLGASVAAKFRFPDHHAFTPGELAGVAEAARRAKARAVVTTAKDSVRLRDGFGFGVPLWILEADLDIQPRRAFERLLESAWTRKQAEMKNHHRNGRKNA